MDNYNKYKIGELCLTSIAYLGIIKDKQGRFTAQDIAKDLHMESKNLGGGWTSLTMKTKGRPPFVLKANTFTREKGRGKGWYWVKNPDLDWASIENTIETILEEEPLIVIKKIKYNK